MSDKKKLSVDKGRVRKTEKLKNDGSDGYVKPLQTVVEKMTSDEIAQSLEDYKKVLPNELVRGRHVRYFKIKKDGSVEFKIGGNVFVTDGLPDYVVLTNGNFSWSVQCKDTIFYQEMTNTEETNELSETIVKLKDKIDELSDRLKEKDKIIKKMEKVINDLELEKNKKSDIKPKKTK